MKGGVASITQSLRQSFWSPFALLLDPALDLLKIVTTDGLKGFLGLLAQSIRVKAGAST